MIKVGINFLHGQLKTKKMGYKIGKKEFKTKTTIKDYFQYILRNNKVGEKLTESYLEDVKGLLEYHTEKDEKIGCGIDYITTERHVDPINGFHSNTSHFHIYRLDGTDIDFSYNNCINNIGKGYKNKDRDDRLKAFRFVIRPQIDEFRTIAFGKKKYLKCEILNINFSKSTCNIDHKAPKTFVNLLDQFLEENNLKLSDIETEDVDNYYGTIKDENIRQKWFNFHKDNCDLRAIHKSANLSQGKTKLKNN